MVDFPCILGKCFIVPRHIIIVKFPLVPNQTAVKANSAPS